jgi:hypothetical protein
MILGSFLVRNLLYLLSMAVRAKMERSGGRSRTADGDRNE